MKIRVYADAIYRTRANRKWCQEHNIRLMGPPLGRLAEEQKAAVHRQAREDEKIRNHIEGKFGQGKRREASFSGDGHFLHPLPKRPLRFPSW